jgi:hypothetical protein
MEARIAALKATEDAARDDDDKRHQAALALAAEAILTYGEGSAEAIRAMQHVADVEHDINEKRKANALKLSEARSEYEIAVLDTQAEAAQRSYEMGEVSGAQEIEQLRRIEQLKYEIRRKGIEAQLADDALSVTQRQLLNLELEQLEAQHAGKMDEILSAADVRLKQHTDAFVDTWTSSWAQGIEAMLNGTMTLSDGVRGIFKSLRDTVIQTISQMATKWIAEQLRMFVFETAQRVKGLAVKKAIDAESKASTVSTALTEVSAKGASAAAGAASSAAAIPYVGWAIAIGAAVAVLAAVLSFKSGIGSAAGGWDIGLENPMAQLHKKEMVLPAHLAERVRNMTEPGGGGGGVTHVHNWTVQTIDAKSFEGALKQHDGVIVKVFTELVRNHRFPAPGPDGTRMKLW